MADYWPQVITAVATLIGAVTGGFVTFAVQTKTKAIERGQNRESLAVAISAEIDAYIDLMEARRHEDLAVQLIEINESGTKQLPGKWITKHEATNDPFPILRANFSQIGILGPICDSLAKFYSAVIATRTTVIASQEGHYDEASAGEIAQLLREELDDWRKAMALGRATASALRSGTSIIDPSPKRRAW